MNQTLLNELRSQWLELQARQASGASSGEAHDADRAALEQRIVETVIAGEAAPALAGSAASPSGQAQLPAASAPAPVAVSAGRLSGPFWAIAGVFVLVLAGVGYGWKGSPQAVGTPPPGFEQTQGSAPGAPQRTGAEQLDTLVKQLTERLEKSPGDLEGWSLLARSQMTLGRYAEAAAAYQKALAIKPEDPGLLTDHADALGVLNGRTLEGEPARLLERALKLDPRHVKALVLVGTLEFQRGNYAAAQKRWQEVVNIGPAGDGLVELAREGVAQAQARQGKPAPTAAVPAAPAAQASAGAAAPGAAAAAAGPGITGTVRLSAALKAQAAPGDVVFIFARAASGGGMPLAILQKRVSDLPAAFTLDDTLAMSPAARLSSAQQVVVTARVSKSGQATPQSGDLEGTSPPVAPGARDLVVEISNVRR
ncbi:MAG: tetratricopeptide repeat protein [Rubrivivax sp.]|nr:tetratricopeptide repeat protein [Rubrivivax sp.]